MKNLINPIVTAIPKAYTGAGGLLCVAVGFIFP